MNVDWSAYRPYIPITDGPYEDLPRKDATRAFAHLMEAKPERIDQLGRFMSASGVQLGSRDADLQALNDWFWQIVERSDSDPDRLSNLSYAVVNDVALFLGDVAISRSPGLRWEMFTGGKRYHSHQRPVITGFSGIPNPLYHVDLGKVLATNGLRRASGLGVRDDLFVALIHETAADA